VLTRGWTLASGMEQVLERAAQAAALRARLRDEAAGVYSAEMELDSAEAAALEDVQSLEEQRVRRRALAEQSQAAV